jgi:hypothetical protein
VEQCFSLTANQPQPAYKPKNSLPNRANESSSKLFYKVQQKNKIKRTYVWFTDFPGASSEGQGALAMPAFFIPLHRLTLPL